MRPSRNARRWLPRGPRSSDETKTAETQSRQPAGQPGVRHVLSAETKASESPPQTIQPGVRRVGPFRRKRGGGSVASTVASTASSCHSDEESTATHPPSQHVRLPRPDLGSTLAPLSSDDGSQTSEHDQEGMNVPARNAVQDDSDKKMAAIAHSLSKYYPPRTSPVSSYREDDISPLSNSMKDGSDHSKSRTGKASAQTSSAVRSATMDGRVSLSDDAILEDDTLRAAEEAQDLEIMQFVLEKSRKETRNEAADSTTDEREEEMLRMAIQLSKLDCGSSHGAASMEGPTPTIQTSVASTTTTEARTETEAERLARMEEDMIMLALEESMKHM